MCDSIGFHVFCIYMSSAVIIEWRIKYIWMCHCIFTVDLQLTAKVQLNWAIPDAFALVYFRIEHFHHCELK